MNETLHPLSLGEVLDRTAQLYRSRFLVYFGIAVIPTGTILVFFAIFFAISEWARTSGGGANSPAQMVVGFGILGLAGLIALPAYLGTTALGYAAMSVAAARAFLGEPISIRESYRSAWKQGWRYVGLFIVAGLIVAVGPFIAFMVLVFGSGLLAVLAKTMGMGDVSTVIGALIFLFIALLGVYCVLALLRICLAFAASVVEQISAWKSIQRSFALTKGTKGRIFVMFLLGLALGWILLIGMSIPLIIVLALVPGASSPAHAERMSEILVFAWYGLSLAVQAFTKPVYGIALTLFYFDQRIRTEGFDIEWQMREAGLAGGPSVEPVDPLREATLVGRDHSVTAVSEQISSELQTHLEAGPPEAETGSSPASE